MTSLSPVLESLAWALVHFVWQGAVIAAGLAVGLRRLRHSRPEARYALACAALLLMASVAAATFFTGWAGSVRSDGAGLAIADSGVAAARQGPGSGPLDGAPVRSAVPRFLPWLLVAWCGGIVPLTARRTVEWLRLHHMVTTAAEIDARWQETVRQLARRVGLPDPIRVSVTSSVTCPLLAGCWRPVILLPLAALSGLPTLYLESAILHELVHVRRWDPIVNRIQLLIETLLFYHPAVWWTSRVIRNEREYCCDAAVVALTGDRIGYARALTEFESLRSATSAQVLAAAGGSLMSRIQQIVRQPVSRSSGSTGPWAFGAATLAVALVAALLVAAPNVAGGPDRNPEVPITWMPATVSQWHVHFVEAAEAHGVDVDLLAIVALLESRGNPEAVSPGGAVGLMQIMPATARRIADARDIESFDLDLLRDPGVNVDFGTWYLAHQLAAFGSGVAPEDAVELAAIAYNAGPKRLRAHLESGRPLTDESLHYSAMVKALWLERNEARSPSFEIWRNARSAR